LSLKANNIPQEVYSAFFGETPVAVTIALFTWISGCGAKDAKGENKRKGAVTMCSALVAKSNLNIGGTSAQTGMSSEPYQDSAVPFFFNPHRTGRMNRTRIIATDEQMKHK
jgi:hypothetical protein